MVTAAATMHCRLPLKHGNQDQRDSEHSHTNVEGDDTIAATTAVTSRALRTGGLWSAQRCQYGMRVSMGRLTKGWCSGVALPSQHAI